MSIGLGVLALGALGAAGLYSTEFVQARRLPTPAPQTVTPAKPEGTLTVDSRPEGAQVTVDNIPRGVTPLKLTLPVGDHTLELQNGSATRSIPLAIQAGVVVSQYVDLAPAAPSAAVGRLEITSDPPGARVTVDGLARGVTPVTLSNVVPGNHAVSIFGEDSTVRRTVTVSAGSTASVMASLTPAGASAGWVAFKVPFEMQLSEGGKLVGTTGTDRLMLPAGRHDLVLSNPAFEFEATLSVQVAAGKTATPTVTIPTGLLSINATPWADVAARRPGRRYDAARESLGARRHPRGHLPSSAARRAAPDRDRQGADAGARRHFVQMIAALSPRPHADRQNVSPCNQHVSVWSCASRRSRVTACHRGGPPAIALPNRSLMLLVTHADRRVDGDEAEHARREIAGRVFREQEDEALAERRAHRRHRAP